MATITITVDDEVEKKFRAEVLEHNGNSKGVLGQAVTEALKIWIEQKVQEDLAQELKRTMESGYEMGKILYKKREELYARE